MKKMKKSLKKMIMTNSRFKGVNVMKKLTVAILMIILTFCTTYSYAEGKLLKNPSFEEGSGEKPDGWDTWAYNSGSVFKVEEGTGHEGKKFVSITNDNDNDARYKQTVAVKENTTYKLSCWVKTENVGSERTGAIISLLDYVYTSKDFKGTNNEWQYAEMFFRPGSGVDSVVVTVGLGGYGNMNTGKAYFDDLSLEEVTNVPDGVTVAPIEKISHNENAASGSNESKSTSTIIIIVLVAILVIGLIVYIVFVSSRSGKNKNNDDQDDDYYDSEDEESSDDDDYDDYE